MSCAVFSCEADIHHIGQGFLDRSLPKAEWTHAAHFAATLWLLRFHPELDLRTELPGFIRAYNESVGGINSDTMGYHETITQAGLRAAQSILAAAPPDTPLHILANGIMASPLGRSDWLLAYWSKDRLMSVEAHRIWVPPDLQAFAY